ncbi:MAG TPA: DUF4783 domain-containing protein [Bacteroidales bacterium]|nr:DUF4783 domain-containing protein [Bacteroidales bacterium]HNZ42073.1 DUF4783 domain-containing protein [Bacteroidales bacterium]HOH83005.1 DUF4783 domain-containing protein [Bacteroidales bacterium]HPB25631.1 DUF4783 domain-containing protein [Bacteroidales bacterium]HPI30629.1 DUF4783 domain-containing protein [Bacteroidales bacterium]
MRHSLIIVVFCLITSSVFAGQQVVPSTGDTTLALVQDDITSAVAAAINAGDAKKLASFFSPSIDLTLPGTEGTYSKSQAEMIVKDFFTKYPPVSFKINQQGSSTEGSQFAVGTMVSKAATFKTYFLIKKRDGLPLVHQLQFEQE